MNQNQSDDQYGRARVQATPELEAYYKDLNNLIEYKENSFPEDNLNNNVDNQLTFGNGYSYGAEFFIKKRTGEV